MVHLAAEISHAKLCPCTMPNKYCKLVSTGCYGYEIMTYFCLRITCLLMYWVKDHTNILLFSRSVIYIFAQSIIIVFLCISGSYHADEIPYVFGFPLLTNASIFGDELSNFTAEEKQISKDVMTYWSNFARSG